MRKLKLVSSVIALTLSLGACGDETDAVNPAPTGNPAPEEGTISMTFTNLPVLGQGFVYEGWLVVDGEVTSVSRFDSDGMEEIVLNEELPAGTESAGAFVLSIEPEDGDPPEPSEVKLLGGDFDAGTAALTIGHSAAIGNDFADASGNFLVATPTSAAMDDEDNGIWYLDPMADPMVSSCLLYTSPSPRDATLSRMPSSA